MNKPWEVVSKKEVFTDEFVAIEDWRVRHSNKEDRSYKMVRHKGDAVFVFGITKNNEVLVLKQFFMSSLDWRHTVIAGLVEQEDLETTAVRELKEEAGCVAREIVYLGKTLKGKWTLGYYHFFVATGVERVTKQSLEESEAIEVEFIPFEKFRRILKDGTIHDVAGVECAYRALDHLKLL